jgi:cytochrome P450
MSEIYYDPYDFDIDANPHPVWHRMRDEAPLYRNDTYEFWALSRYEDVAAGLTDWRTYSSARGTLLELIRHNVQFPPGTILFEDPPIHATHRALLARLFTPRRIAQIEPRVRAYCVSSLDPLVGASRIDFIADLGSQMPMRVIGMLLGIPEADQEELRDAIDAALSLEEDASALGAISQGDEGPVDQTARFAQYIEWRREHPSDDLMTELLNARFVDDHGVERTLRDDELLGYIGLLAGAGNETTTRLIGWTAYLLDRFPDQRRLLAEDRSLVPNAIEEILRYEAPSPVQARYVTRGVELHGTRVPEGSTLLLLNGSANRDEREFEDADRLDVQRRDIHHLSFGYGIHFCLGASLARLQAGVALEEILARWTEWEIDHQGAEMAHTSTVRGWKKLPARLRPRRSDARKRVHI